MRVLQVTDHYPPDGGGVATHVERLSRCLVARGHEVKVVAASSTDSEEAGEDVAVRRVASSFSKVPGVYEVDSPPFHPPWPDRAFRRGLERVAAGFDPDVVHAHGWCIHSAVGCHPAWSGRVVGTLHDHGTACPKKSLLRHGSECLSARGTACLGCDEQPLAKRASLALALATTTPKLSRRVGRLLAVSGYVARRAEQVGIPAELLEVLPNFVDIPAGPASDGSHERAGAPPYLLYAGPAAPHKGRQVLLEAFAGIDRDLNLRLAGGDGSVAVDGVSDLGYQTGEALAALYRDALAVVVPSIWPDPCPTVALEAMAWGRPVIAGAVGGLTEIVEQGASGLLVPPGDAPALRGAIEQLLDDPALRERMGRRGRERVARFSTATVLPRLEQVYLNAAAGRDLRELKSATVGSL
jgi:glycosyltransferase involved in cell wall biosynthesis